MLIEVHFTGDQFIAYDQQGNQITDTKILNEVSMEPYIGTKGVYVVNVDLPSGYNPSPKLNINVNTFIKD
jgi:hypothetical protein